MSQLHGIGDGWPPLAREDPVSARFEGKSAIVSGASSGIGLATAKRLGAEGASVVIVAAPSDSEDLEKAAEGLREAGVAVKELVADISDVATGPQAVELATKSFGGVDVLINNAGFSYFEEFLDSPVEHLDRTLAVNVRGTFLMTQASARVMAERGAGSIVMTASTASFMGEEFNVTYNASKAAVVGLVRSLAVDLAPVGIRVNAVAPGWVATRSTKPVREDRTQWDKHRSRIPLDRAATVDEIAAAHAFLASDDASYITGAVLLCDGGVTAGFRYSNWAAAELPEGTVIGRPAVSKTMGRPQAL